MDGHDRDAILARRALFISAALTGLACTTHERREQPDSKPEQSAVEGRRPSWSRIMAAAPRLDVPKGSSESETESLTRLESKMRGRYAELEKVWNTLPTCAPSQAECEAWAASVVAIITAQHDWGPLCGGSPPQRTNTYREHERAHEAYLRLIGDLLLADLDAAAKAHGGAADVTAWGELRAKVMNPPRPCLSCLIGSDPGLPL
jgi:hypothetical protein